MVFFSNDIDYQINYRSIVKQDDDFEYLSDFRKSFEYTGSQNYPVRFKKSPVDWCPDFDYKFRIVTNFASILKEKTSNGWVAIQSPTSAEKRALLASRIFVQFPDDGTEIEIPRQKRGPVKLYWGLNSPIVFSFDLNNFRKYFTSETSDFYGVFNKKGIYSEEIGKRKYIRIEQASFVGGKCVGKISFPRLAIDSCLGTDTLSISGVDEISYILNDKQSFETFTPEEALTPVYSSLGTAEVGNPPETYNTYRRFKSFYLTDNKYDSNSELLINFAKPGNITATYDTTTRILTLSNPVNEKYSVTLVNALSMKNIIESICHQAVDAKAEKVTYDYFPLAQEYTDFKVYSSVICSNTPPIDVVKDCIKSFGGEYLIVPSGNKLTFLIRPFPVTKSYKKDTIPYIPESLFKNEVTPSDKIQERFNTINVIRHSTTAEAQQSYWEVSTDE